MPPPLPPSGKPPRSRLASVFVAPSVPSRLTRLLSSCAGPGAPTHLGEASRGVADFPDHQSRPTPSPHTGEIRHRVVVLFRCPTLAFSCRADARDSHDTVGEHLPVIWPLGTRCLSHHVGALGAHRWVSSEPRALPRVLQNAEWALRPGRPCWLVDHASRPPVHAGNAARHMSQAAKAAVGLGPVLISARWPGNSKKILFFCLT
jgi:hypothetical protein